MSMRFPLFPLSSLSLLMACGDTGKLAADSSSGGGAPVTDDGRTCQSEVMVPTGTLPGDPVPAAPHMDAYGADPDPFHVHLGLPTRDPSTSISMIWRTDADTLASVVEFGPAEAWPAQTTRVEGYTFGFGGGELGTGPYRVHEVRLCDRLEPGKAYTYRVGGDGGWSAPFTFTTPGTPGSFDTFRVAMAGDSRGAYDTWAQVVTAMESHEPDLFLFSGDMVELGALQSEWDAWFTASGDAFARKPIIPAHGNHEFLAQNYFAQFGAPGNEEWFAIEYGDMLVLSLNDTVRDAEEVDTLQSGFVAAELAGTSSRWQVALHHQPLYSRSSTHGSSEALQAAWGPVYDAGGMDLVVNGHNHTYERSVPIKGGAEVSPEEGTRYMVTGGAGAPLYTGVDEAWFGLVAEPVNHYVIADFVGGTATFTVRDLSGNIIDEWTMQR